MFLEYGMNQHSELVHISQVNSGIVDLECPYCGVGLIARKGNIKEHHFAHNGDTCREVAERDKKPFIVPYYDVFDLGLDKGDMHILKSIVGEDGHTATYSKHSKLWWKDLEERGFIKYNDFAYRGSGDWELTHRGGIPFGRTTLKMFADIQREQIIKRHDQFSQVVRNAWKGKPNINYEYSKRWAEFNKVTLPDKELYDVMPQPDMIPAALADLNIYRAQLRRILSTKLYFLEIEASGNTFYKVGVTGRELPERIIEIERDLFPHFGKVNVKLLRALAHRGGIEFYFKHRYQDNRMPLGTLTEYFTFDNRKNVLSDLSKLGDYEPDEIDLAIINSHPSAIEIEIIEHAESERLRIEMEARRAARQEAIKQGMVEAKAAGIHVGRPVETDILAKYPQVVEAIQQRIPLRQIVKDTGIARNTIRRVKAAMESNQLRGEV